MIVRVGREAEETWMALCSNKSSSEIGGWRGGWSGGLLVEVAWLVNCLRVIGMGIWERAL